MKIPNHNAGELVGGSQTAAPAIPMEGTLPQAGIGLPDTAEQRPVANDQSRPCAAASENPHITKCDNNIRYSRALPDFKWINKEIPVLEVAQKLGLAVRGKKAICPECGKARLTFTTVHNGWKCWSCDASGKMHSAIDLVMLYRNCSAYEAAKWIGENWRVGGRLQIEYSQNAHGRERHTYQRYRPIHVPDRSKPSIQALVASPGWRNMPLSTRVIAVTLFAMAEPEDKHVASVSRRALGTMAGVHKPTTIARAVRELEAIGLFAVGRGSWGERGYKASTFRLTWWSQAFQAWLRQGYAPPLTLPPHHQESTSNTETFGTKPPPGQRPESGLKVISEGNSHPMRSERCQPALTEGGSN
jgi:hypothetical protein